MNKSIKQIVEEMYTKPDEFEQQSRQELYKLENLLRQVGGTGNLKNLMDKETSEFLELLFRNGITFTLTGEKKYKLGSKSSEHGGTEIIGP